MSFSRSVRKRVRRPAPEAAAKHARLVWPLLPLIAGALLWLAVDDAIDKERQGFDQVIANLHYFPDAVRDYLLALTGLSVSRAVADRRRGQFVERQDHRAEDAAPAAPPADPQHFLP